MKLYGLWREQPVTAWLLHLAVVMVAGVGSQPRQYGEAGALWLLTAVLWAITVHRLVRGERLSWPGLLLYLAMTVSVFLPFYIGLEEAVRPSTPTAVGMALMTLACACGTLILPLRYIYDREPTWGKAQPALA